LLPRLPTDGPSDPSDQFLKELPGASERLHFFKADLLVPGAFDEVMRGELPDACAVPACLSHGPRPHTLLLLLHVRARCHARDPHGLARAPARVQRSLQPGGGPRGGRDQERLRLHRQVRCATPPPAQPTTHHTPPDGLALAAPLTPAASVRRVVLTSSIRAVFGFGCEKPPGYLYSEDDWNTTSTLANNQAYALSKTLAEVRAWMNLPRPCMHAWEGGRASHVVTCDVPAPPSQQAAWEYARNQSQYTLVAVNPGKPPLDDERAIHKGGRHMAHVYISTPCPLTRDGVRPHALQQRRRHEHRAVPGPHDRWVGMLCP
jgi:hypothetical protein